MIDPTTPGAVTAIATTLGPLFRVLPQIFERLVKPGATELGLFVSQEISALRRRRLIALDAALEKELVGRTPAAEPMDPVYLLDVLEGACRAGDDDVTALWARLLAANVETPETRHPLFVRLVAGMSRADANAFAWHCHERRSRTTVASHEWRDFCDATERLLAAGVLIAKPESSRFAGKGLGGLSQAFEVTLGTLSRIELSGSGRQLGTALGLIPPRTRA